jgi:SAM-dependent methyltransferase
MAKFQTMIYLLRNNFTLRPSHLFFLIKHALILVLFNHETKQQFSNIYGDFNRGRDLRPYRIFNPGSEGGAILGEVVHFVSTVKLNGGKILLAGDRNDVKKIWERFFPDASFFTGGMHDMDFTWNYEDSPPPELATLHFDLIISHAMLEHLVDPVKHFRDLVSMLKPGGYFVVHSVLPGYFYHRVPIDCFRFYPDWFEEMAKRCQLEVIDRQISVFNITYKLQRI